MPDQIPAWAREKAREIVDWFEAPVRWGPTTGDLEAEIGKALVAAKLDGWREGREAAAARADQFALGPNAAAAIRALPDPEEKVKPRTIYGAPGESEGTHDNDT